MKYRLSVPGVLLTFLGAVIAFILFHTIRAVAPVLVFFGYLLLASLATDVRGADQLADAIRDEEPSYRRLVALVRKVEGSVDSFRLWRERYGPYGLLWRSKCAQYGPHPEGAAGRQVRAGELTTETRREVGEVCELQKRLGVETVYVGRHNDNVYFTMWSMPPPGDMGGLIFSQTDSREELSRSHSGKHIMVALADLDGWFYWEDL